ncbi:DUF4283 domain-containing protein [Cephalotus follicularis]|uniref:DUF4283 domain-containing protein n=1 Tax=Cephalotus follicularis TaxID=3775 RepID=A0A1Q3C938_CEPFO|nr:DUF4283 domain-containing protein [Cephalotus follicularis]
MPALVQASAEVAHNPAPNLLPSASAPILPPTLPSSWKNIFSPSNNPYSALQFFEPSLVDGIRRVEHALVAFLVGKWFPAKSVKEVMLWKWGQVGSFSFHSVSNGVFLVKFENGQARYWVMDNRPWDIWGYHLALRKWSKGMSLKLEECNTIHVWVKLSNVPIQFCTKMGLSYIASVLGRPLYMDASTTNKISLSYARVCVDMAATSSFPSSILLELEDGVTTSIGVEYPWRQQACTMCKVFDHSNRICPKATRREWLPKPVVEACRKPEDVEGWITVKRRNNRAKVEPVPTLMDGENVTSNNGKEDKGKASNHDPKTPVKVGENIIPSNKSPVPASATPDNNPLSSKVLSIDGGGALKDSKGKGVIDGSPPDISKDLRGKGMTVESPTGSANGSKKKKRKGHCGMGALPSHPDD